jgi:hypothetical protein
MKIATTTVATCTVGASFWTSTGAPSTCSTKEIGPCSVVTCQAASTPDGGIPRPPNAGEIKITGGTDPFDLTVDGTTGNYSPLAVYKTVFLGGEQVVFDAAGGDVPKFSDSVTAPKAAVLISPELPRTGALVVDRAHPPSFAWTNGDSQVLLQLGQTSGQLSRVVACIFDGAGGTGAVPAEALAHFTAGSGFVSLVSRSQKIIQVDNWNIALLANANVTDSSGALAIGNVTFQ